MLWTKRLERVVTDADREYSGSSVGTIEQAMRRTMADSLRLVAGDLLRSLDALDLAARRRMGYRRVVRPPTVTADAPGRVNVIGEHTDYNGGLVLPVAIPQRTRAALAPGDDETVRAASALVNGGQIHTYRLGEERPGRGWLDYVQGITQVLRAEGHRIAGFDLRLESDVPVGSGVSSSAALEVAVLRAVRRAFALPVDDVALALLAQRAESGFVGARVGVMDPMASSLADTETALFLDTRSLAYRRLPLPAAMELVVVDSGVVHRHAAGEYNRRRAECEEAAARLGVPLLRDVTPADLARLDLLPDPLGRRVRHVVTENERVLAAVDALAAGDAARLGALLGASHRSLRDDYEVSTPELDLLVELAHADPAVHGARLTGGGFGGSIVMVARAGSGRAAGARVARFYAERTGLTATVLVPSA